MIEANSSQAMKDFQEKLEQISFKEITLESFDSVIELGDLFIKCSNSEQYANNDIFINILDFINNATSHYRASNFQTISNILDKYIKKDKDIQKDQTDKQKLENEMANHYSETFRELKPELLEVRHYIPKYFVQKATPLWVIFLITLILLVIVLAVYIDKSSMLNELSSRKSQLEEDGQPIPSWINVALEVINFFKTNSN